jgi:hypothetical protein
MKLGERVTHRHYPDCVGRFAGEEQSDEDKSLGYVVWETRMGEPITERDRQTLGCYFPLRELWRATR